MKRIFAALGLIAALLPAVAAAQTLPANTVLGRLGIGPGPAQAIPFAVLTSNLFLSGFCTTAGAFPIYNATSGAWVCSTVGGTGSLATLTGGPLTINPTTSTLNQALNTNQVAVGTTAVPLNLNQFAISNDTVTAGTNFVDGWSFIHNFGAGSGGRQSLSISSTLVNPMSGSNQNFVALTPQIKSSINNGGGSGTELGLLFTENPVAQLLSGATFYAELNTNETDIAVATGASAKFVTGLKITQLGNHAVHGTSAEGALVFTNQSGAAGWNALITFGSYNGGVNPIASGGTLLSAIGSPTIGHGIDLSGATCSTDCFKSTGFLVDGSGNITGNAFNKVTITPPASGATLTIANGKTVTHNATTTFSGTDGKTLTINNSGTLAGGDGFSLAIAANKTLTVSNSLTMAGIDATTQTFPATSQTIAGLAVSGQTFTTPQTITTSVTSGTGGLTLGITQTQPNASDTVDSAQKLSYTLSASSATNELIARVFQLSVTNSLTGGGAISNMRSMDIATNTSASTTTTELDHIYLEAGTTAGTVTTGIGVNIATIQGTTKWGIFDQSGANEYFGAAVGVGTQSVGAAGSITATNFIKSTGATAGIGYATGAGGAVTQTTSRTTGVTLNTASGDITLVSAAGSATFQTFTVTDSAVVATDTLSVVQKSGADKYQIFVTNVAAGSFQITFATTGGTTTEQPVFHFNVLKGANSFLLNRDLGPANDNLPAFLEIAA